MKLLKRVGTCCLTLLKTFDVFALREECRKVSNNDPRTPTGVFGPSGPEVCLGVSDRVPPKMGVFGRLFEGVSPGSFVPRSPETPPRTLPHRWGNPKQHMKLQQPRNYDFWMLQFNLLGSQGGNSREMTTSPPGHIIER